jgi:hypothetical protein
MPNRQVVRAHVLISMSRASILRVLSTPGDNYDSIATNRADKKTAEEIFLASVDSVETSESSYPELLLSGLVQ